MTTKNIEKFINLLNENKLQELREELTQELLKSTDKLSADLFTTIKKYLKNTDNAHPLLKNIQHKNGRQFVCDGFTAYIFNTYKKELENLPQVSEQDSLNIFSILDSNAIYSKINENDLILIQNINKYISLYKTQQWYNKKEEMIVKLANKYFNAEFILTLKKVFDDNLNELEIADLGNNRAIQFKTNDITAIVLPIRVPKHDDFKQFDDFAELFIKQLKD